MICREALVFLNRIEIDADYLSAGGQVSSPVVTYAAELLGADLSLVSRIEEKEHRLPSGLAELPALSIPIREVDCGCELADSRTRRSLGTGHVSSVLRPRNSGRFFPCLPGRCGFERPAVSVHSDRCPEILKDEPSLAARGECLAEPVASVKARQLTALFHLFNLQGRQLAETCKLGMSKPGFTSRPQQELTKISAHRIARNITQSRPQGAK